MRIPAFLLLLLFAVRSSLGQFQVIDQIQFGNFYSESIQHSCTFVNAPASTGGLGQSSRKLGSGGSIAFTIACNPAAQNFITVKLWGSDTVTERQYLYLYDPADRIGEYETANSELMFWHDVQRGFVGRFVYSTYPIPLGLTSGKTSVTLKLADAQLGIYKVYTHLDPFFEPTGETQGTAVNLGQPAPSPNGMTQLQFVRYQAQIALDEVLKWQKYGPEWDQKVAQGNAPAMFTGAVTEYGRGGQDTWTKDQWKADIYTRFTVANLSSLTALRSYALAYHNQWSSKYQNPEMIDRVLKALEFFRIAQGANGGYWNPWSIPWVGGPDRQNAGNPLDGFGSHALAEAFLMLQNQITPAMLSVTFDDDDNPATPPVTREAAFIELFKGIRDFCINISRGHATNQDDAQVYAAFKANECLKILAPAQAWSDTSMKVYVYQALGLTYNTVYEGCRWFSLKGMALEGNGIINGGYCGNYSPSPMRFMHNFAAGINDPQIDAHISKYVEAFSMYCFPQNDDSGYGGLANEMAINYRPNRYPGNQFPSENYIPGLYYAASVLGDQTAIRILNLYVNNGRVFKMDRTNLYTGHYSTESVGTIETAAIYEGILSLPQTSYRLSNEREDDFVFTDEEGGSVVVKDGDARMYITLNWRHGYSGTVRSAAEAVPNDIARVHYTTSTIDRIANITMESVDGIFGLYKARYGKYLIMLNCSKTKTYSQSVPDSFVTDLVTSNTYNPGQTITILPQTTVVLDVSEPQFCGDNNTPYNASDFNKDCRVDIIDFAVYADMWAESVLLQ